MTDTLTLTTVPVQVSDGTKEVHLTVSKGTRPRYATGATIPATDKYHELTDSVMNIGIGFSVWMWKVTSETVEINYSVGV